MPPGLPAPGSTEHPRAEAPAPRCQPGLPPIHGLQTLTRGEARGAWLARLELWAAGPFKHPKRAAAGLPASAGCSRRTDTPSTTLSAPHQAKVAVLPSAPAGSLLGVFCRWSCEPAGGECARNTAGETGRLGPNGPLPKAWRCHAPRRVRGAQNALCFPLLSPHSGQAPVLVMQSPYFVVCNNEGAGWTISRRR